MPCTEFKLSIFKTELHIRVVTFAFSITTPQTQLILAYVQYILHNSVYCSICMY